MAAPNLKEKMGSVWSSFRDFANLTTYSEVWLEKGKNSALPRKENYRDGNLTGSAATAEHLFRGKIINPEYVPSFAVGICRFIGGGDYKLVFADQDGQSDHVIKMPYGLAYTGEAAEERANLAAHKLRQIHEIIDQIAPGIVLPATWTVEEKVDGFRVYERQQRALPVDINLLDPKTAYELNREADEIAIKGSNRLRAELIKRGLSRKGIHNPGKTEEYLQILELHYDFITNHLVALDIYDTLDITPLLPPGLSPTGEDFGL